MSKIKLTNMEIENLAYWAVKSTGEDESLEEKCRQLTEKYVQAKKILSDMNGEKLKSLNQPVSGLTVMRE